MFEKLCQPTWKSLRIQAPTISTKPADCQSHDHYDDVIMSTIASQITSLTIVYSAVYSGADQSKHQSSASLAFVWGIHRGPVNSPHKWPVTRKMFPFDDVIMCLPNVDCLLIVVRLYAAYYVLLSHSNQHVACWWPVVPGYLQPSRWRHSTFFMNAPW